MDVFCLELLRDLGQNEGEHVGGDLVELVDERQRVLLQLRLDRAACNDDGDSRTYVRARESVVVVVVEAEYFVGDATNCIREETRTSRQNLHTREARL